MGHWGQRRKSQEQQACNLGAESWFPVNKTCNILLHVTISLSCFANVKTPTRQKKIKRYAAHKHRAQTSWTQKVHDADFHLSCHQPMRRRSTNWYGSLWTMNIKLLSSPSRFRHSFEDISLLWPPLLGKAIKLFFSTSSKTPPLRIN